MVGNNELFDKGKVSKIIKIIKMKIVFLLITIVCFCILGCSNVKKEINIITYKNDTDYIEYLKREDWDDFVKKSLNDLMNMYGKTKTGENNYVVFDFDNTCSIFDIEEQLAIYQLSKMAFNIKKEELANILKTGLSNLDEDLTDLGYGKGSYNDWIDDITNAYDYLYDEYGPFTAKGLDDDKEKEVINDPMWLEFATKMRTMYDLVYDNESADVAYPWILYWFTGMTEDEVYNLAFKSHTFYKKAVSTKKTWTSPDTIDSKVGQVQYTYIAGIQVSENIIELWKALRIAGIDVWVCSASSIDVVKAAVDVWGLHDYISGILAMTNKIEKGKYINEYDYENGTYQKGLENGLWIKGKLFTRAETQGVGKVTAINNTLFVEYGHGPIAGFMDSTGDYNFCTEYNTLKLVCCFNRASRKVTDGGGVIAEVAVYEEDILGYDLEKANAVGDTLYVLQGRDENGLRSLRNSRKSIILGEVDEKLFANENNEIQLTYIIDNKMKVKDIIDKFAIKTSSEESEIGFRYGFLNEYAGYHTHD